MSAITGGSSTKEKKLNLPAMARVLILILLMGAILNYGWALDELADYCLTNETVCWNKTDNSQGYINQTCYQYYVCMAGCTFVFTCPGNLQYNLQEGLCDFHGNIDCPWETLPPSGGPSAVLCEQPGKCLNKTDGTLLPDESNPNRYIICQGECDIARPCPGGLIFNSKLKSCVYSDNVISPNPTPETPNPEITVAPSTSSQSLPDPTTPGSAGSPTPGTLVTPTASPSTPEAPNTTIELDDSCLNDLTICEDKVDNSQGYVNDTCSQYYVCVAGCTYVFTCPDNLLYDLQSHECVFPENVDCPWENIPPGGPSAGPSGTSCEQPGVCLNKTDGTLLPDDSNPNHYIICQCECEIIRPCPGGLIFNSEQKACVFPGTTVTGIPSTPTPSQAAPDTTTPGKPITPGTPTPDVTATPTPSQTVPTTGTTGTPEITTPDNPNTPTPSTAIPNTTSSGTPVTPTPGTPVTPTPSPSTPDAPNTTPEVDDSCLNDLTICEDKVDNSQGYVNDTCSQYYVCVAGCTYVFTCPDNLLYDLQNHECVFPENVDCPWENIPPGGPSAGPSGTSCEQPGVCLNKTDGTLLPDNSNPNHYIICQCECEIIRPCPGGLVFNSELKACVFPGTTVTGIPSTPTPSQAAPDTTTPGKPITPGTPNPDVTATGTTGTPDIPTPVNPNTPTPDTAVPNTTTPVTPGTPTPGTPVTPTPSPSTPNAPNTTPELDDSCLNDLTICEDKVDNSQGYVNDTCSRYYVCVAGCTYVFTCPDNLLYDLQSHECVFPENVDCPWENIPPGGPSAGPSGTSCEQPGVCLNKTDGTLLPDDSNPNHYIICQCECEIIRPCPSGLIFNSEQKACVFPGTTVTGIPSTPTPSQAVPDTTTPGKPITPGTPNPDVTATPTPSQTVPTTGTTGTPEIPTPDNPNTPTPSTAIPNTTTSGTPVTPTPGTPVTPTPSPSTPDAPNTTPEVDDSCLNDLTICEDKADNSQGYVNDTCSQYYVCVAGCTYVFTCPDNLLYDLQNHECVFPENVDCPWENIPPGGPSAGPSGTLCDQPGVCLNKTDGTLLPDDSNPNHYIICQCECEIIRPCPSGLIFNSEQKACVFPGTTVTGIPSTPTPSQAVPDTTTPGKPITPGTPNPDVTATPTPSQTVPTTGTTGTPEIPTPDNPNTPTPSTAIPNTTTSGTPVTPTPGTPVTPTPSPSTPDTPNTTPEVDDSCLNDLTICEDKADNSQGYVNDTCSQYYVCVAGCTYVFTCPDNLLYDLQNHECVFPENVDCPWENVPPGGPSAGPSGTSCDQPGVCLNKTDGTLLPDDSNPNHYIICQCECEIIRPCPGGLVFNSELKACVFPENSTSTEVPVSGSPATLTPTTDFSATATPSQVIPDTSSPGTSIPNTKATTTAKTPGVSTRSTVVSCLNNLTACQDKPDNYMSYINGTCSQYYICVAGCTNVFNCPYNLQFNTLTGQCDFHYNVHCLWETLPPGGSSPGQSGIACEEPGMCFNQRDGTILPNNSNQNSYIVCQCECEIIRPCPGGLIFNNVLKSCDFPQTTD